MKRKIAFLVLVICVSIGLGSLIFAKQSTPKKDDLYMQIELFASAMSFIRTDYVDEIESKELIYGALRGMLMSLDSYSQFLDPDDYNEIKVETEGKFGGLGIEITLRDGILTVIAAIEDTPADKAGLKSNDMIVRIDGKSTKSITLTEAVKKLRGEPGSDVTVTILREKEKRLFDVVITRGG